MMRHIILVITALAFNVLISPAHAGEANPAVLEHLTLRDALVLLADGNREIRAAQRMVEGLRADGISAAQRPNPTLSINTQSISLERSNSGRAWDKPVDTVIRLDQVIERGDKRELRVKAAEQAVKAGRANIADTIRQQRLALTASYYDLLLAQEKERINRQNIQLHERTLAAARLRLKAGDISASDLARLEVEAYRADNELNQAQAESEKARLSLAYVLSVEREASRIKATDAWPEPAVMPVPEFDEAIARRADVRAAQAAVDLADARRAQARALQTRDISVGVQYEHFPPESRNTVGVGVSFPLFAHYSYEGEIKRAESDYNDARENLERAAAQARTEIAQNRADLQAAAERLRRFREGLLEKAQKTANAAEFAYLQGAQGLMDLLDARRTLRAMQLDAAAAQADYAKASVAWVAAIAPSEEP